MTPTSASEVVRQATESAMSISPTSDWILVLVTCFLFAATVALAIATFLIWRANADLVRLTKSILGENTELRNQTTRLANATEKFAQSTSEYRDISEKTLAELQTQVDATQQAAIATHASAQATEQSVVQMKDGVRPILVPRGTPLLAGSTSAERGPSFLRALNIGMGPALDVKCRIDRVFPYNAGGTQTQIAEDETRIAPVSARESEIVYALTSDNQQGEEPCCLMFTYEDIYRRRFITRAEYKNRGWANVNIEPG